MDQSGSLVSKLTGASLSGLERDKEKEEKMARKHRSLGVGIPNSSKERVRDRRRGESIAVSLSGSSATPRASIGSSGALRDRDRDRHSRQSSSSSTHDASHARRTFTDFSHLPPSPSTSTIPSFLRHSTSITSVDATSPNHTSPNVAHSLLRGTQEGWSGLDDSTTAEALRKLDGISGKSVRARSSFGSGGSRGGSRPVTPVSKGAVTSAWEGRESIVVVREKEQPQRDSKVSRASTVGKDSSQPVSTHVENGDGQDYYLVPSGDRAAVPAPQTTPVHQSVRKSMGSAPGSARSSFGQQPLKRGSVSSVSITGTPTTGSRDSTSLSTTTSATSASVVSSLSHRHSLGKLRRNSTSSDVSSVHSTDFSSQRDRAAALATTGSASIDALDDDHPLNTKIPPVPPLPKEYQSPVPSSTGYAFPALSSPNAGVRSSLLGSPTSGPGEQTDDPDRTIMVPFIDIPPSSPPQKRASPVPHRTPQKKWSFSSALSLKLSSSSKDLHSSSSPLSPKLQRSMQTNQNHNQERRVSTTSAILTKNSGDRQDKYQARSQEALHLRPSASSSSLLPIQSSPSSPSPAPYMPSKTPDRHVLSRSDSASSASTRTGTAAPPSEDPGSPLKKSATSKRLTPSAIPFFRRSSSQSMQLPPSNANMSVSPSAPPGIDISYHASSSSVSTTDSNPRIELAPSPSMQAPPSAHKKSSVLSLGLPSLLKGSSSRKSLHVEKPEPKKEKKEKEEKSEGRISVLMGRKRGKVCSSP
jgi:dual specificity tyrosine-phosphorylation-regulated kinase 2/3/4